MSQEAARTPGATRAGDGEYLFDLAKVNHILGGPDYSTANGACVEGDRMIVGLMRMPAGTGAEPHSHPERAMDLYPAGHVPGEDRRQGDRGQARLGGLRPLQCGAFRQGHAGWRCRVLHLQGRLAQSARHQGRLNRYRRIGGSGKVKGDKIARAFACFGGRAWATINGKPPTFRWSGDKNES